MTARGRNSAGQEKARTRVAEERPEHIALVQCTFSGRSEPGSATYHFVDEHVCRVDLCARGVPAHDVVAREHVALVQCTLPGRSEPGSTSIKRYVPLRG